MDSIFLFFSSVNKLSFIVFLVGLCFFCYELFELIKEKEKKLKPQIPQFNANDFDNKTVVTASTGLISKKNESIFARVNVHIVLTIILFVMTVFFFFLSIISIKTTKEKSSTKTEIIYSEVQSKGIKIYSQNLTKELTEMELSQLPEGTEIVIGIDTIQDTDIDRARIKINEKEWNIKHITTLFDSVKKMFYTKYVIATGESKLSIDAQLHSFRDGWLGN